MAKTLVTGASGFLGSHLVRALAERGDDLRLLARRSSNLDPVADLDFERATGDVTDRRAVRRAMDGVARVFHVAGRTSLRARDREAVFAANLRGARTVFEEALAAEVERARPHLDRRRDRDREAEGHRRRDHPVRDRPPRARLRQLQARGRARGVPARRSRAARGDRQPHLRARPRRPDRHLDGSRSPLPARPDPRLRRWRAQHRRRPRRRRRAPARRREGRGRRALHPRRAQLHARPPVRRPGADLRRRAAAAQAARRDRARRGRGGAASAAAAAGDRRRGPLRAPCGGPTATRRPSASWGSTLGRTSRRSRTPSSGSESSWAVAEPSCGPERFALRAVGRLVRAGERLAGR